MCGSPDESPRTSVAAAGSYQAPVRRIRGEERAFHPDLESFAVVRHRSAIIDYWEGSRVRDAHHAAAERLPEDRSGTDCLDIFDHSSRRHIPCDMDHLDDSRRPTTRMHIARVARSGAREARDLIPTKPPRGGMRVINGSRLTNHLADDTPSEVGEVPSIEFLETMPADLIYLIM
jgi:hypothetical protein